MKVHLMYETSDYDPEAPLPFNASDLINDLNLSTLFEAMAGDDEFLLKVSQSAVLTPLRNIEGILFRQAVLQDCLDNLATVQEMYGLAVAAIQEEKKHYFGILNRYPSSILYRSVEVLEMFIEQLHKLRKVVDDTANQFNSPGFQRLFKMLKQELDDAYFAKLEHHLEQLKFREGVWLTAELGIGNRGVNYILRTPRQENRGFLQRMFSNRKPGYTFRIADRDESGTRALSELRDRGINLVANALAQSVNHVLSFFKQLRSELGFYLACSRLHKEMTDCNMSICFPEPLPVTDRKHSFQELYDVCLALRLKRPVVGNAITGESKEIVIITGANQGGKSTFLRSIGLAQLMMQCGMFVSAQAFQANLCNGLFTHFSREEDAAMNSGKWDEELSRMSELINHMVPHSMLLCNESFSSTNEREGSEIARQITLALVESKVKVFFVTHLYEFAHSCYSAERNRTQFLRAPRKQDGSRTFKLEEGEPLQTSFGEDLYEQIFVPGYA